jgi:hypothetical protein
VCGLAIGRVIFTGKKFFWVGLKSLEFMRVEKRGEFFSDVNTWLGGCPLDVFRPSFYYLDFLCP